MADYETAEDVVEGADTLTTTGFGGGDLGRVQALLFGDHARHTTDRIDQLEQALLGALTDLRSDMDAGLADVRSEMDARLTEIDRRIIAESEIRSKALTNLESRVDGSIADLGGTVRDHVKALTKADRALERDLAKASEKLTAKIDRTATVAKDTLDLTRQDLSDQIEQANTTLRESNVDRGALAGMMAAVAEQLAQEKG